MRAPGAAAGDSGALFLEIFARVLLPIKGNKDAFIIFRFNFFILCQGGAGYGLFRLW